MNNQLTELGGFEKILGTPSAQRVLKLLVIWDKLSLQDIISKSGTSKTQVHTTLTNLKQLDLVSSPSRGIYTLLDNQFGNHIRQAYNILILEGISSEIYRIEQDIKNEQISEARVKFKNLVDRYQPILIASFSQVMNSLSHSFIELLE